MKQVDVLIVDDDVALSDVLSDVLDAKGYHVVVANNGSQAIEQVKNISFDLALMDVRMPGMNGVEVYKAIKRIQPEILAIMMTAYAVEDLLEEALREGALDIFYKPLDMDQLLALVQSVAGESAVETTLGLPDNPLLPAIRNVGSVSVLIVEDYAWQREALADLLELWGGYDVEMAATSWEAMSKARTKLFDIALLDLKLPDISGVELLHRLKQIQPTVEGLILTGHASVESAARALRESAFAYLVKPLHADELMATIEEALEKQRLARERERELARQRQEAERHRFLAIQDPLTKLYNRRHFDQRVEREVAMSARYGHLVSLLMIDIDGFKAYNDAFGHLAGDEALRQVAQALRSGCREVDIVARYGGDEFIVLLPETPVTSAVRVAQRLRKAIATLGVGLNRTPAHPGLTVSIGVAQHETGGSSRTLVLMADQALYAAKRERNSVCVWDPEKKSPRPVGLGDDAT